MRLIEEVRADMRSGIRNLRQNRAFTIVAVLTLAIGIAANTVVFSQINAVFLKTLDVRNPEQLRTLAWTSPKRGFAGLGFQNIRSGEESQQVATFSYPAYLNMRDRTSGFSALAAWTGATVNAGEWGRLSAHVVTGNYFQALGTSALIGRTITPDDDRAGAPPVAVISYGLWQRAFAGNRDALSRQLKINQTNFSVIGVMPQGFFGLNPANMPDVIAPMSSYSAIVYTQAGTPAALANDWRVCQVVGRLRRAVPEEQARQEAEAAVRQTILANPPTPPASPDYEMPRIWLNDVSRGLDNLRTSTLSPLRLLMSGVSLLLIIACVNVAGMLLARGTARQQEMATRIALGASRRRLVRQVLTESLLFSIVGGAAGIVLTHAFDRLLPNLLAQLTATPPGVKSSPDARVLSFSIALSILTGLAFGLAPALRTTNVNLISAMKKTAAGRTFRYRSGKALVALQVGLSMIMLLGAGLFIRTVMNLRSEPLGFDADRLLMFRVDPGPSGYGGLRMRDFFESAVKRLEALPGVVAASGAGAPPMAFTANTPICIPGYNPPSQADMFVGLNAIAPRYFETLQLKLIAGSDVSWANREASAKVAIVNEAFANKFFRDKDPLGQILHLSLCSPNSTPIQVVGLVADSKTGMRQEIRPTMYLAFRQPPPALSFMTFLIRTNGDPAALLPTIRKTMAELDAGMPIFGEATGLAVRDQIMRQERLMMIFLIIFGSIALLLSCLGIYGMLAYVVARRTPEVGIRMALGAQRADVVRMVLRESLIPVSIGMIVGVAVAFSLTPWIQSMLFGVSSNDPWTIAAIASIFLLSSIAATWLPAYRASRIHPMHALRYE